MSAQVMDKYKLALTEILVQLKTALSNCAVRVFLPELSKFRDAFHVLAK
jgi:hypothetical protein